jgi:hypothetical protein
MENIIFFKTWALLKSAKIQRIRGVKDSLSLKKTVWNAYCLSKLMYLTVLIAGQYINFTFPLNNVIHQNALKRFDYWKNPAFDVNRIAFPTF